MPRRYRCFGCDPTDSGRGPDAGSAGSGDRRFASGGEDGLVYIVGMDDRRPLFGLWDEAPVSKVAWSKDDSHLAVGYASGRVSVSPVPFNA